mgnify:FL=1
MNMRNSILFFFVLTVGICFSNFLVEADEGLVLKDREPMVLFCNVETGRVEFQTRFNRFGPAFSDRKLSRMKRKVEKLFKSKMLEFGGYTIELDGYPIWGPYGSFGPGESKINLFFAEKFTVDHESKTIIIVGSKEKPSFYYPYNFPGY